MFSTSIFLISLSLLSPALCRQLKNRQEFKPTSTHEESTTISSTSTPTNIPSAIIHSVDVGKELFTFSPDTIHASIGDIIDFYFYPENHSVAESTFLDPCHPKSGGVDAKSIFSGFLPIHYYPGVTLPSNNDSKEGEVVVASHKFSMQINNTDTIWLYCSQTFAGEDHCQKGQVMVINPLDRDNQTLAEYKRVASRSTNTTSPKSVYGGVLVKIPQGGDSHVNGSMLLNETSNCTLKSEGSLVGHGVGFGSQMALLVGLGMMTFALGF